MLVGIGIGQVLGIAPPFPIPDVGLHLPHLVMPTWAQILHGTEYAVVPQIPLTLTNAIIVTAAVSRQLFPRELHPVNERNLAVTTGIESGYAMLKTIPDAVLGGLMLFSGI